MSDHTCFAEMNERLKPHNAQIAHGFGISNALNKITLSYFVQTEKTGYEYPKRGVILASFNAG